MSILMKLLIAIFGHPDITKLALVIRGFLFAVGGALLSGAVDFLTQLMAQLVAQQPIAINWGIILHTTLCAVVPVLLTWSASLAAWLKAQSSVPIEALNRMLEIGISLPVGAVPDDAKAIFVSEQKAEQEEVKE